MSTIQPTIADIMTAIQVAATAAYNVQIDAENPFDRTFIVTEPSGAQYLVDLAICRCSCKTAKTRGICSHIEYVHEIEYVFELEKQDEPFWKLCGDHREWGGFYNIFPATPAGGEQAGCQYADKIEIGWDRVTLLYIYHDGEEWKQRVVAEHRTTPLLPLVN